MGKTLDNIEPGELILTLHYMGGARERGVPSKMVLSEYLEGRDEFSFVASKVSVLHPYQDRDKTVIPFVTKDYSASVYMFKPIGNGEKFSVSLNEVAHTNSGERYIGLDAIIEKLENTKGFEMHANSLKDLRKTK